MHIHAFVVVGNLESMYFEFGTLGALRDSGNKATPGYKKAQEALKTSSYVKLDSISTGRKGYWDVARND